MPYPLPKETQEIISNSNFEIHSGVYIYCQTRRLPAEGEHFLITKDADEITVVTLRENLVYLDMIERNKDDYCLIALNVSIPFYSVGFLASVSAAFAEKGHNILIVSTYSKDYVLARYDLKENAKEILLSLGLKPLTST